MRCSSPSKDLYFSNPLRRMVNIIAETKNTITLTDRIICFRIPSSAELSYIAESKLDVVSVIDDSYWAIVRDRHMPLGYRVRILCRLLRNASRLRNLTTRWVVTSPMLEASHPGSIRIDPCWNIGDSDGSALNTEGLHLGFLGTRSHLQDLRMILPFIIPFLRDSKIARLSLFLGKHCPKGLSELPNVTNYEPMNWETYRNFLGGINIDISLLPIANTKVNECRSRNKLFEAVYAGGLCLFGEHYTHKDFARKHQLGFSYSPQKLHELIESYLENRCRLRQLQHTAKVNAITLQGGIVEKQKKALLDF